MGKHEHLSTVYSVRNELKALAWAVTATCTPAIQALWACASHADGMALIPWFNLGLVEWDRGWGWIFLLGSKTPQYHSHRLPTIP